jgi:hypothetical protein
MELQTTNPVVGFTAQTLTFGWAGFNLDL